MGWHKPFLVAQSRATQFLLSLPETWGKAQHDDLGNNSHDALLTNHDGEVPNP